MVSSIPGEEEPEAPATEEEVVSRVGTFLAGIFVFLNKFTNDLTFLSRHKNQ